MIGVFPSVIITLLLFDSLKFINASIDLYLRIVGVRLAFISSLACYIPSASVILAAFSPSARKISLCFLPSAAIIAICFAPSASITLR
jgi:hypothetical protein